MTQFIIKNQKKFQRCLLREGGIEGMDKIMEIWA